MRIFLPGCKHFSDATFEIEDIGLFDLNSMKVVRNLHTFFLTLISGNLMKRIKNISRCFQEWLKTLSRGHFWNSKWENFMGEKN